MDAGKRLLEVERLSRRHYYVGSDGLRVHKDPVFDEEKRLLMERISKDNKREIAKRLGIDIKKLPKKSNH